MEPTAAQFGHLFSWRHPAAAAAATTMQDLTHAAAYRYNQNMMEYYTCKSKFGVHSCCRSIHLIAFSNANFDETLLEFSIPI